MKTTTSKFINSKYVKSFFISLVLILSITLFTGMAFAICYLDDDGDGYGDPAEQRGCGNPNAVANSDDCNDADPDINPDTVWYKDVDGDDYSDGSTLTQCEQPTNYYLAAELTATSGDCNDGEDTIYPGATEVCDNDIDEDCNGYVDDLKVDCNGSGYTTIQAGINATATTNCDTVLVYPCTYTENVDFDGNNVEVISRDGAATTIIDADSNESGVVFETSETSAAVLDGFTITNAMDYSYGIETTASSPTIKNCIIANYTEHATGVWIFMGSPTFEDCTISNNTGTNGGGVHCGLGATPTFNRCTVSDNTSFRYGGGFLFYSGTEPVLTNCIITGNQAGQNQGAFSPCGGGVYLNDTIATITNCTISGNTLDPHPNYYGYGGGIFCGEDDLIATNSIIYDNTADYGHEIYGTPYITYSDIGQSGPWHDTPTTNIDDDPEFESGDCNNYDLGSTTECIDGGTTTGAPSDDICGNTRDGSPDMGAVEDVD
jgi:parallel beta-helix repeat protein